VLEGKWAEVAIDKCGHYLASRLAGWNPKVIVALGNTALNKLTGFTGITNFRGYVFENRQAPTVAALHPAYIRRGKSQLLPTLVYDLQKALRIARGTYTDYMGHPSYVKPPYQLTPGVDEAWAFYNRVRDNQQLTLVYDIENPSTGDTEEDERESLAFDALVQIQFSLGKREGIAFPWEEPYITIARKILEETENDKAGHNIWLYDNPVMKVLHGIQVKGRLHDTLAMFHHAYPDLEAGLQKAVSIFDFPFPWKHLAGSDLAFYGCADVDAPHWMLEKLPEQMKAKGIWDGYVKQVKGFYPILVRMQDRGVGVNVEYREEFKGLLETKLAETDKELQATVPNAVLRPHPAKGYKTVPGEVVAFTERWEYHRALFEEQGKKMVTPLGEYVERQTGYQEREFEVKEDELGKSERDSLECMAMGVNGDGSSFDLLVSEIDNGSGQDTQKIVKVRRWCKLTPFSARSSQQVIKYIRWAAKQDKAGKRTKHVVPLTLKDKKETTSKEELERLYFNTGDPVYKLIVEFREYAKILSNDIPAWEPGADGRVHTTFTMAPASGQLSSRSPNIQNVVKHTKGESFRFKREIELGKGFRKMIVPAPGRVLMEFDKSSFHVVMLGREAKSANYIKIARADMHSFFTSYLIHQPIDPTMDYEELKERCKWIKKNFKGIRDTKAKPTILGVGLGLGANKLWHTNRENIESPTEAKNLLAILHDIFPEVFKWQDTVRLEAHRKGYLVSPWGFTRSFFDVFQNKKDPRTGKWRLMPGADSEKAIAFFVQNNAFGMMRHEMMRLERMNANERFWLVNTVHDSLVYDVVRKDQEYCYQVVTKVMNAPCKVLADSEVCPDGLVVTVECGVGENWSELKEFKV
jgi:hypothetical protein